MFVYLCLFTDNEMREILKNLVVVRPVELKLILGTPKAIRTVGKLGRIYYKRA